MCSDLLSLCNHDVLKILQAYSSFSYTPQHSQWTVLASFFLIRHSPPDDALSGSSGEIKIISLATGTKCLPLQRLSPQGEVVHDSHAEVLARRCALRWFLEEVCRIHSQGRDGMSGWIFRTSNGKYALREGVKLYLYISTVPCGDASMQFLASNQDEGMATLKNSSAFPDLGPTAASRGRDNYARLGVLRTKPGRADSPPTPCMSCSDKIARWNVLGIQGALGSQFLEPLYFDKIIIGEVPLDAQASVKQDCERALWKRLGNLRDLPERFSINQPEIHFTSNSFAHSQSVLGSSTPCNESLCWTGDSQNFEVIINGLKRGVSPKHRHREKSRPRISKIAMLQLYKQVLQSLEKPPPSGHDLYLHVKLLSGDYQRAKAKLLGKGGPFEGWIFSGVELQRFNVNGEVLS